MTDLSTAPLRDHLATFVVPQTGRLLGTAGTSLDVQRSGTGWRVAIQCGFPLERSRATLVEALSVHCAALGLAEPIEFAVSTSIVAHAVQHGLKPLPGVHNIIAVASGKGGVGKSTVAVNFALALAQEGARVGILDADIYGPSQPRMLGLMGRKPETRDGKTLEPLTAHGLEAMSIGFLVDDRQPMAWRGPMVTSALNQLLMQTNWGNLDYLV
ncbi:MAG TPA: P-loop NTPase, partial [Gammaproteobacteria bacterium]|nr:P-loop NTPase [Gammaproteobacteria bacterium]